MRIIYCTVLSNSAIVTSEVKILTKILAKSDITIYSRDNRPDGVLIGLKIRFDRPSGRINLVLTGRPVKKWLRGSIGFSCLGK